MEGFVRISKYAGMREDLVQAGGGNSSFKESNNRMFIKASGYQLADVSADDGYAVIDYSIIRDEFLNYPNIADMPYEMAKSILQQAFIKGARPSIETFLHSISGKYTLHTHPIVVNVLACRKGGMEILREMFPDALLVPYATPGSELSKTYFKFYMDKIRDTQSAIDIIFLKNHGLLISADSADEVIERTESVIRKIENYLHINNSAYHNVTKLWKHFPGKIIWRVTDSNILNAHHNFDNYWGHTFCPDCVVFLGKKVLKLSDDKIDDEIKTFYTNYGQPVIVDYHKTTYIIADSVRKAMEIQSVLSFSAQVMILNKSHECDFLDETEQNFLLNWDAEKYRRAMK